MFVQEISKRFVYVPAHRRRFHLWWIAWIVAIVVVIAIAIGIFLQRRKRLRVVQYPAQNNEYYKNEQQYQPPQLPYGAYGYNPQQGYQAGYDQQGYSNVQQPQYNASQQQGYGSQLVYGQQRDAEFDSYAPPEGPPPVHQKN